MKPNVFWISIDSLRKDFLHAYAPLKMRQTYLDELAESGCVFENAFPGANWTPPSHACMLTGLDASSHSVWSWSNRLDSGIKTAFDLFHESGYVTGCFALPHLGELFAETKVDHAGETLSPSLFKCIESSGPFFAFWHTYNVHYPYGIECPMDFEGESDYDFGHAGLNYLRHLILTGQSEIITESYRREVQAVSRFVKIVTSRLRKLGKLENTLFIITADHGEAWRPNITFHCNFEEEVLRVPLAIAGPGIVPSRASTVVSLSGLLPTVMELCGLEAESLNAGFDGASFASEINGGCGQASPIVLGGANGGFSNHNYVAVRDARWMLIKAVNHPFESFHQVCSAGSSTNLLDRELPDDGARSLQEFRSILERQVERSLSNKQITVPPGKETERKLRALGYV